MLLSGTPGWSIAALLVFAAAPAGAAPELAGWGALPLSFEPNRGQTAPSVDFLVRSQEGIGFLAGGALTVRFERCVASDTRPRALPRGCRSYAFRMRLDGATRRKSDGLDPLPGIASYLIGKDPSRWVTGLPTYGAVTYRDALPGIDLRYHGSGRHLELDMVLAPSADPGRLRLAFDGADSVQLDPKGDLRISIADQALTLRRPFAYQEIDGARREVAAQYVVKGKRRVAVALGERDRTRPVVVDPVLVYSAQFGSGTNDGLEAVAVDANGVAFAAGFTESASFPTIGNPIYPGSRGVTDAVLVKLNASGTALLYSTYFGGDGTDVAYGLAIDTAGNAVITGDTTSSNLPSPGGFQSTLGGAIDAFVAKLNSTGTALVYSTYVGGLNDDHGDAVALDGTSAAYVTGNTFSADWPSTAAVVLPSISGSQDAFVLKLNPAGLKTYGTFLGGNLADFAQGIAVDASGNALVAGGTFSVNFLGTPTGFQFQNAGGSDAFVTKLNADASATVFSTYFGGLQDDQATCLALDPANGGAIFAGQTTSTNTFPRSANAFQTSNAGGFDAFAAELNSAGGLVFSTYVGGGGDDTAWAVAKGAAGSVWIAGRTASANFPLFGGPYQGNNAGSGDAFLAQLNGSGTGVLYSTYLGGPNDDRALGLAIDGLGSAYIVGESRSGFPTTPGSYVSPIRGAVDAFAAKFREPITLTAVNPASGPTDGGTPVSLVGSNFVSNLSVSFGTSSVSTVLVSPTVLNAVTPAHAAGPVDVVVTATDGLRSNTLVNGFTYVTPDAGPPDAGPPDAGPPDAGPPDAGPPDAGPPDAGPPDAGPPDAGPPDAGPPDAGPPDAGPPDSGTDAGVADAGGADGGPGDGGQLDAGETDGGIPPGSIDLLGCSCASGGAGPTAIAFAAMVAFVRRARQRRRPISAPASQ
jgi:MYXO-CTERM domain-containing protein